jgi:16S rRNA (uracil1498-N3)-methyltransferase
MIDNALANSDFTMLFYESEIRLHIKEVLEKHILQNETINKRTVKSISFITGPEGGFEPHETELARSHKIPIVSLGPRILRSETAPIVALAAIMYQTNNL